MKNADYDFELYDSIRRVDRGESNSLRDATTDPFMDPRFIEAVENAIGSASRFRHVVVWDAQGRPMATACLSSYSIDGASLAKGPVRKVIALLEQRATSALARQPTRSNTTSLAATRSRCPFTLKADAGPCESS